MELFCGIDVGTRSSSFCVLDRDQKVVKAWSGLTARICEELSKVPGKKKCILEAGPRTSGQHADGSLLTREKPAKVATKIKKHGCPR